jgi:hypothetical protein
VGWQDELRMTSQIDPTKPIFGTPTTQSVRDNFSRAASEITALQNGMTNAPFLPLAGGALGGALLLAADPTQATQAATKNYVDATLAGIAGGVYAPLSSPHFAGVPTAPTPPTPDNSTAIPTTAWVRNVIATGGFVTSITAGQGLSGGTIATSGTIALVSPVTVANGGTQATSRNGALDSLANASGTTVGVLSRTSGGNWNVSPAGAGTITAVNAGTGLTGGGGTGDVTVAVAVPLTLNTNAAALPAPPTASQGLLQLGSADGQATGVTLNCFGSASTNVGVMRHARGTAAAMTATQSGDPLGYYQWYGRGATGYGISAYIQAQAAENFTDTANGGRIDVATVPTGTTSLLTRLRIQNGLQVYSSGGAPAGGDLGPGTINAAGNIGGSAFTGVGGGATGDWVQLGFLNGNGPKVVCGGSTSGAYPNLVVFVNSAGTSLLYSDNSGNLTIGGATATKPGGGSWVAPSDRSLKSTAEAWPTGLAEVLALNPISYRYTDDAWNHEHCDHVGLDAEEAGAVIPEMARTVAVPRYPASQSDDSMTPDTTEASAVDTGPLLMAVVNAIKEIVERLAALEAARRP